MIIEIAIGVCLGIVLAAIVIRFWRQLLASSIAFLALGVVAAICLLIWFNFNKIATALATGAGAAAILAVLYLIPFWAYQRIVTRFPNLDVLLKGEPPWNTVARLPVRLLVMALFAIAVAALGIGALFGSLGAIGYIADAIQHK